MDCPSNAASSPRNDSLLWTALALQQLAYVRLAVQASNQIDTPPVNSQRTVKTGTSIYQRLDRPQLPATIVQLHSITRPTSAYPHLAVSPRLDLRQLPSSNVQLRTSMTQPYQLLTSSILLKTKYNRYGLYTHVCKSGNKSSLLLYLLSCLCSLHCLWLSLLARI